MINIINFILSHPGCTADPCGDQIRVSGEIVLADGTVATESALIPATMQAAKIWLGY